MKYLVKNEKELENIAEKLVDDLNNYHDNGAKVIALYGNLGAGKTTFTKEIANYLKIQEKITSPTFNILKSFEIKNSELQTKSGEMIKFKKLIHIDTYRLDLPQELERLGFKELLNDTDNLIVIEWPEIVEEILPENTVRVKFEILDSTTRELSIN